MALPSNGGTAASPADGNENENGPHKMRRVKSGVITRRRPIIGRGLPESAFGKPLGVIYVSHLAPFMSLVNRAIKTLDEGPGGAKWSATKVLPLDDRVKAHQKAIKASHDAEKQATMARSARDLKLVRQRQVLLLATGHAIGKLVLVAGWFSRQQAYVVEMRTRWSATVDDLIVLDDEAETEAGQAETGDADTDLNMVDADMEAGGAGEEASAKSKDPQIPEHKSRLRHVSCLEVAVRLA